MQLLEQVCVGARSYEDHLLARTAAFQLVDQEEITTDVALSMVSPLADQGMILPLRCQLGPPAYRREALSSS